jgi:hypothetical protein
MAPAHERSRRAGSDDADQPDAQQTNGPETNGPEATAAAELSWPELAALRDRLTRKYH